MQVNQLVHFNNNIKACDRERLKNAIHGWKRLVEDEITFYEFWIIYSSDEFKNITHERKKQLNVVYIDEIVERFPALNKIHDYLKTKEASNKKNSK